jgi:hypothetical protein
MNIYTNSVNLQLNSENKGGQYEFYLSLSKIIHLSILDRFVRITLITKMPPETVYIFTKITLI